jgi:hypothetical protein
MAAKVGVGVRQGMSEFDQKIRGSALRLRSGFSKLKCPSAGSGHALGSSGGRLGSEDQPFDYAQDVDDQKIGMPFGRLRTGPWIDMLDTITDIRDMEKGKRKPRAMLTFAPNYEVNLRDLQRIHKLLRLHHRKLGILETTRVSGDDDPHSGRQCTSKLEIIFKFRPIA